MGERGYLLYRILTETAGQDFRNAIDIVGCGNFRYTGGMAKTLALLFGIVFLLIGILGFVPALAPNEMLLNIFHVNAAHNAVHLLTGVIALVAGMAGVGASKTFFKIFGVVYGLVAVLGFVVGDGMLLGLISNNAADTWLHVGIALVSLIIGFAPSGEPTRTTV